MESRKVVIVGAGIGDLSVGYWLRQRGYEVEMLEASDRPGGRMIIVERKGDRVDVGMQVSHGNYRHTFELIDAMDLSSTKRRVAGKKQYTFEDGFLYVHDQRNPYMKLAGLRGKLRMYVFILKHILFGRCLPSYTISKDMPDYDNMEMFDAFASPRDQALCASPRGAQDRAQC